MARLKRRLTCANAACAIESNPLWTPSPPCLGKPLLAAAFLLLQPAVEGRGTYAQPRGRLLAGDVPSPVVCAGAAPVPGLALRRPLEPHATRLGRGYPFRLALADGLALYLGDVAEELEHEIGDQLPRQTVLAPPRVQQGHVENDDIDVQLLRHVPPLVDDVVLVATQPVDGLHDEHVARTQAAHQPLPGGALEVLAARLVLVDPAALDAEGA